MSNRRDSLKGSFPSRWQALAYLILLVAMVSAVVALAIATAHDAPCNGETRGTCPPASAAETVPIVVFLAAGGSLAWLAHAVARRVRGLGIPLHAGRLRDWQAVYWYLAFGLLVPAALDRLRSYRSD